MHEDYIPTDPTNVATVRVDDELLRYATGLVERSMNDLCDRTSLGSPPLFE